VCPAASLKTVSSIRSSVTDTVLPQTIFLCGLPRTGSTVVFNIARLLVTQVDARSISGWYATKNKKGKTVLDLAVKARRVHFSVVKTHYLTVSVFVYLSFSCRGSKVCRGSLRIEL